MHSGIYQILNKINGKFYIGSAVNFRKRFETHKSKLNRKVHDNPKLQAAWDYYGIDAFEFQILERCSKDELIMKEQLWLDWTNARETGYNILKIAGSSIGYKHIEEFKKNRSEIYKGRKVSEAQKLKTSASLKGLKKPEGFSAKLSANKMGNKNMLGKRHSEEAKKKMSIKRKETVDRKRKADIILLSLKTQINLGEDRNV